MREERAGSVIGQYEVVHRVDARTSEVYLARAVGEHHGPRFVLILLELREVDARIVEAEVKRCQGVDHRAVARPIEMFDHQGKRVVVLDSVQGTSLDRLMTQLQAEEERLPPKAVYHVGQGLFGALHAAHSLEDDQGKSTPVVHGQLGPHQVMVSWSGAITVMGFGMSRVYHLAESVLEQADTLGGFMAPEQRAGYSATPRGNVYSAAAIIWSLLTNELPPSDGSKPESLLTRRPDLPVPFAKLVDQALEPALTQRNITAGELAEVCAEYDGGDGRRDLRWVLEVIRGLGEGTLDLVASGSYPPSKLSNIPGGSIPPKSSMPPAAQEAEPENWRPDPLEQFEGAGVYAFIGGRRAKRKRTKPAAPRDEGPPPSADDAVPTQRAESEPAPSAKTEEPKLTQAKRAPAAKTDDPEPAAADQAPAERDQLLSDLRKAVTGESLEPETATKKTGPREDEPVVEVREEPDETDLPGWDVRSAPALLGRFGTQQKAPASPPRASAPKASDDDADERVTPLPPPMLSTSSDAPDGEHAGDTQLSFEDEATPELPPTVAAEAESDTPLEEEGEPEGILVRPSLRPGALSEAPFFTPSHFPPTIGGPPFTTFDSERPSLTNGPLAIESAAVDATLRRSPGPASVPLKWAAISVFAVLVAFAGGMLLAREPARVDVAAMPAAAPTTPVEAPSSQLPPAAATPAATPTATPMASAAASASAVASSASTSADPPTPSTPRTTPLPDGKKLHSSRGYLVVHCPERPDLRAYLSGRVVKLGEPANVSCGLVNVRLGTFPLGTWYGQGQTVPVACRAVTEVNLKPGRAITPGRERGQDGRPAGSSADEEPTYEPTGTADPSVASEP